MYINTAGVPDLILDWPTMKLLSVKYFPRECKSVTVELNRNGYPMFKASMRGEFRRHQYLIHDLVAIYQLQQHGYIGTFIPDKPQKWVVHHINMNKLDARPANLVAMPEKIHNRMHAKLAEISRQSGINVVELSQFTSGMSMDGLVSLPQELQDALSEICDMISDYRNNAAKYINEEYSCSQSLRLRQGN